MKKFLLSILTASAVAVTATAAIPTPKIFDYSAIQQLSADGRYAVSSVYGTVVIFDLQNGTKKVFEADYEETYYDLGFGTCITADGSIITGSTREDTNAAYFDGEKWCSLNVPNERMTNLSNGITPDGSRICGSIGIHELTVDEDVLMQAPVIWNRNSDGTFGDCIRLPFPETDFFGSTPQQISALSISADGKTIVGMVTDCRGFYIVPIVYTEDENGKWAYSFPTEKYFNPEGLEIIHNPGESPELKDFMTEEERNAYNAALTEYFETYEGDFPVEEDYMSASEIAAYNEAFSKWESLYYPYNDRYYEIMGASPNFMFNNVFISPDGKHIAATVQETIENPDPLGWFPFIDWNIPVTIDVASGNMVKHQHNQSMSVCGFPADNVVLATTGLDNMPIEGFIIIDGNITNIADYLSALSPELKTWINENLSQETEVGGYWDDDLDDWISEYEELVFTGIPVATPDLKVIAFFNNAPWNWDLGAQSVVFNLDGLSGFNDSLADDTTVALDEAGNLIVGDSVVSVTVYDLAGIAVLNVENPQSVVTLDLMHGAYIVKAETTDGTTKVIKISK